MGCCAVSQNKDGNFVIDYLTRNSETNRISIGRKTVNKDDIEQEMKNSPHEIGDGVRNPEELLKQQLSYRGVSLVDFQTFQNMVPKGVNLTPTKRRESASPLHSSPRFMSSTSSISLVSNKPPAYDPQELNQRKVAALMGTSSGHKQSRELGGFNLALGSSNIMNISNKSTAVSSNFSQSQEAKLNLGNSYRGDESPVLRRVTNTPSRSPRRESFTQSSKLVQVISPGSNNGSPLLPRSRIIYQNASPLNCSAMSRPEMSSVLMEPRLYQRSVSPVMPERGVLVNNLNIQNKLMATGKIPIQNFPPSIAPDLNARANFHFNSSPLRLQAAAVPSKSFVLNSPSRESSPMVEIPLQEGPIRTQASPIGYHVAQHRMSGPLYRSIEGQDIESPISNMIPFQGAPLVNSQVFDPEIKHPQDALYQHVPMKYNAETIQNLTNKENFVEKQNSEPPNAQRMPVKVAVDLKEKLIHQDQYQQREELTKKAVPPQEVLGSIDNTLTSRGLEQTVKESSTGRPSSDVDVQKFPFQNAKPVTVKLLKPKAANPSENKPNVFLQNKDGSPGRTIEMQIVKAVHVKAPIKETLKSAGILAVSSVPQGAAVKKDLPTTINEVDDESSKSIVHSEGFASNPINSNTDQRNLSVQSKSSSSSSNPNKNSKQSEETVSLTVNLIGDSIKDNFVLQRISEILPSYIVPDFDKDRRKVKYVVPRAEIERNPQIQTLFQKIQGVQAVEKSTQSKNSKSQAEANTKPNTSSDSSSKLKQYMTESPKEVRKQGDSSTTFAANSSQARKRDFERTLLIEDGGQNNQYSSFPRDLLEDSPLANKSLSHQRVDSPPRNKDEFREELMKSDREKESYKYDNAPEQGKGFRMSRDEVPSRNFSKAALTEFDRRNSQSSSNPDSNPYRKDKGTKK